MAWFRLHESTLDNPKVQKLPDRLFKGWVNILCVASRYGGLLPSIADIAFAMRKSEEEVKKLVTALVVANLIDETDEGLKPHDWSDHQFQSDVSTPRVKQFRKRQKERNETVSRNAPEQSRAEQTLRDPPNGGPPEGNQTPRLAAEGALPQGRAPAITLSAKRMPT